MFEETEQGLKQFDKTQRERWERHLFEELKPFLKIQSDETLKRWDHTTGRQNLYALFRPFAAQFTFPWLKIPGPVIRDFFRKVMVARLVDTFLRESGRRVYLAGVPGPYILYLDEVCSRLMPLRKEREAEHQQRVIEERQATLAARMEQHQSADAAIEDDAEQPVAVKLKVLQNGINARNVIGFPTREWELKSNLLAYNARSLKMAHEFFDTNPAATPGHLLSVMEASAQYIAENPDPHGEYDPKYVIRKGAHLTSLLKELPAIVAATQLSEDVPAFQLVPTGTDNNPGSPERSAPRGRNG